MQAARLHDLAYLRQHEAAGVAGGERHGMDVHVDRFFFGADVASGVGVRAPHDGNIDRERLVAQDVPPVDAHQLDQRVPAAGVATPAVLARVHEGAQPRVREQPGPARADLRSKCWTTPPGKQ